MMDDPRTATGSLAGLTLRSDPIQLAEFLRGPVWEDIQTVIAARILVLQTGLGNAGGEIDDEKTTEWKFIRNSLRYQGMLKENYFMLHGLIDSIMYRIEEQLRAADAAKEA